MTATDDNSCVPDDGVVDEGLRCPACEYNLTGLAGGVCPECGAPFDVDQLRAVLEGKAADQPIPGWDDDSKAGLLMRLVRMTCRAWFTPTEFARNLPASPSYRSGARYSLTCFAIALVGFVFAAAFDKFWASVVAFWFFLCTWLYLYSEFLAAFLSEGVPLRRKLGKSAQRYWRGVLHFTSFHVVLAAIGAMAAPMLEVYRIGIQEDVTIVMTAGLVLNYWLNLARLIDGGMASRRHWFMIVLVIVPALGLMTAALVALLTFTFAAIVGLLVGLL